MKRMVAMVAALSLVVAGCAQLYAPAVNLEGVDQARYEADLDQCRGEVAATAPSVPAGFIGGAVLSKAIATTSPPTTSSTRSASG